MEIAAANSVLFTVFLTVSPSGTIWHGTARFYGTERGTDEKSVCAAIVPNRATQIVPNRAAQSCQIVPLYKPRN
ncbi:hypothetical protein ACKFKG_26800 [Phormidesmis sp. 146-35]